MKDELMTSMEVANFLKISKKTLYRMIKGGKISYIKFGREYRFYKKDVLNLIHRSKLWLLNKVN